MVFWSREKIFCSLPWTSDRTQIRSFYVQWVLKTNYSLSREAAIEKLSQVSFHDLMQGSGMSTSIWTQSGDLVEIFCYCAEVALSSMPAKALTLLFQRKHVSGPKLLFTILSFRPWWKWRSIQAPVSADK